VATLSLRQEAVELLQRLIQLNTVNPPGNETRAADLLRDYLEANGVACELFARTPERANLVARIPGTGAGPRLLLLSHTDTVVADPTEWTVDPWSGDVRGDEVWGRGALDMKGEVAASAVTIASLAREGFQPAGDLIFAACADEEVGEATQYGLPWLVEAHPEAVRCEFSINEGAGERVQFGDRVLYLCGTAEKMSSPFQLVVHGRSGHASTPAIADNALVKAAPLVERLGRFSMPPRLGPETEAMLAAITGGAAPAAERALEVARSFDPLAAELVEPLLTMTVAPTLIEASRQRNVIPASCTVTVDCRLLPGQGRDEAEAAIRDCLGAADYDFEWLHAHGGTRSPHLSPLWEAVVSFVDEIEPGAIAVPLVGPGFTDSHWLRAAFGTVAYGFFPMRTMDPEVAARLVHSADERVAVEDLELGVRFLRHAARWIGGLRSFRG
jgi:acetylornithine deacetylase/succinyl-diaminopimelate desuccinylase-like protein